MRITAGKVKGHRLKMPKRSSVRPTTEMVREAVFSILENIVPHWSRVLDLYAGSGALGIEALSRGAEWADFVEQDPRCCATIRENLEHTGLAGQARVYCCSVAKALSLLQESYDVILLDPPYSNSSLERVLDTLVKSKLVSKDSIIVVQHSSHLPLALAYDSFHLLKNRQYGETFISIYRKGGGN